jgi:hypothetical protein
MGLGAPLPAVRYRPAPVSKIDPPPPSKIGRHHPAAIFGMDKDKDLQAVTIRWPRWLHGRMVAIAEHQHRSLNNLIIALARGFEERYRRERP